MIRFLLVAKDWAGGLARYLHMALQQRDDLITHWLATHPSTMDERLVNRLNRRRWRKNLLTQINCAQRDIALFVNVPPDPEELNYHQANILWLTDAPRYTAQQLAAFSRVYVSDPGYAQEVMDIVGADRFAGILPFACQPQVHTPQPACADTDVCFIGNRDPDRDAYLRQLLNSKHSCHIFGNYFAAHPLFWDHPSAFRPTVSNLALAKIYARHRISLNIHARVVRAGTNMRTFECAACDIAQLVEYRPGIEALFVPDEEICLFRSTEEFASILPRVLADSGLRKTLRHNARARVLAEHTYAHRLGTLLEDF